MCGIQDCQKSEFVQNVNQPIGIVKRCLECGKIKTLNEFNKRKTTKDGLYSQCKECQAAYFRERYLKNKETAIKKAREWYLKNKEKVAEGARKRYAAELANGRKKARGKARKRRATLKGKLNNSMCVGVWQSLCGNKGRKHWETMVGFTIADLKKHLENQFTNGMTWENYGSYWHLDHKIPKSVFNFDTANDIDFKKCWCLKNLQPLEATENMRKSNKLDKPFQPALLLAI